MFMFARSADKFFFKSVWKSLYVDVCKSFIYTFHHIFVCHSIISYKNFSIEQKSILVAE